MQINHVPVPEAEFCRALGEFMELVEQSGEQPSYFELLIAFAFWEFKRRGVDYAVVEVGLGGLLDGTNVISRADKVCVITDIGLDHTHILGGSLRDIAAQKAGIIQSGNHVFMYDQGNDVVAAARQRSDSQGATLHLVDTGLADPARQLDLPLFQKRNFRLAYQAVAYVLERDSRLPLKPSQLEGAATVYIPGRMETLHIAGKTVILDGAHNVQKMTALVTSLRERYPSTPVAAVVAVAEAQDMRWQGALEVLVPEMQYVIATAFEVGQDVPKQSVTPQGVADYVRSFSEVGVEVRPHIVDALQALLARPEPLVLVTGSLYLMGMAKAHLKDLL